MKPIKQLWLPEVKGVEKISKQRKTSEPQVRKSLPIKKFELQHHPFDLQFRFRLHRWLESTFAKDKSQLRNLIGYKEYRRLRLYLYPQSSDSKWLTQVQVAKIMKENTVYKFRSRLVHSLLVIWEKIRV